MIDVEVAVDDSLSMLDRQVPRAVRDSIVHHCHGLPRVFSIGRARVEPHPLENPEAMDRCVAALLSLYDAGGLALIVANSSPVECRPDIDCDVCRGFGLVPSTLPLLGPGHVWESCTCADPFGDRYGDEELVLPAWQIDTLQDLVPSTQRAPVSAAAPTLRAP